MVTLCSAERVPFVRRVRRPKMTPLSSAPSFLREPLQPRLRGPQSHCRPARRLWSAQLLQHGGRGASCRPPARIPRLLKGLLDNVLRPLQLQPVPTTAASARPLLGPTSGCFGFGRWRRLGGGSGCDGRQLGDVLLSHRTPRKCWARLNFVAYL